MERGALATDFFLIAFDEAGGRPALHPDLLACGLVGAQLADLVVAGALTIDGDLQVVATGPPPREADEATALVLDSVAHEPRAHAVRAWVDALGVPLPELVRGALVRRGVLAVEQRRGVLGRRRTRLTVTDPAAAHAPGTSLRAMVRHPATFTLHGAFTLVLVSALGVEQLLEPEIDRTTARSIAAGAGTHLPVSLARLHDGLTETAAAISLSVRR